MMSKVFASAAEVTRSAAEVIASAAPLERALRTLSARLSEVGDESSPKEQHRRGPVQPKPTCNFTEVDAAKAERGLRNLGVRKSS